MDSVPIPCVSVIRRTLLVAVFLMCHPALAGECEFSARPTPATPPASETPSPSASSVPADKIPIPAAKTSPDPKEREAELVVEHYRNGSAKVRREVTLDDEYNYVNHGRYTMYDQEGNVLRAGRYEMGEMDGEWTQYCDATTGNLLSDTRKRGFSPPFVSKATFVLGQLDGIWSIVEDGGQPVFEWSFEKGVRQGPAIWWHANGKKRREVMYEKGLPTGQCRDWSADGKLTRTTVFVDGRSVTKKVGWHAKGRKAYEGTALAAQELVQPDFDWWNTRVASATSVGEVPELKHGVWTEWYPNGQKRVEGTYRENLSVGSFTWWYDNGQKQAEAHYEDGLKTGIWMTWHENGMKESMQTYAHGVESGRWMLWKPDGKLVKIHEFDLESRGEPDFIVEEQPAIGLQEEPEPTSDSMEAGASESVGAVESNDQLL